MNRGTHHNVPTDFDLDVELEFNSYDVISTIQNLALDESGDNNNGLSERLFTKPTPHWILDLPNRGRTVIKLRQHVNESEDDRGDVLLEDFDNVSIVNSEMTFLPWMPELEVLKFYLVYSLQNLRYRLQMRHIMRKMSFKVLFVFV